MYKNLKQYGKILAITLRDIFEQDILKLNSKQVYEARKFGYRFPRPLQGLEAKVQI